MPLPEDQQRALNEIVIRARRMYRIAFKMQTLDAPLKSLALADLYVDSQIVRSYAEMLWQESGRLARREMDAGLETPSDPDIDGPREPEA